MKVFLLRVKKFFSNKNTVTILCVILALFVIWFGYNYRVNQAIRPVKVPIAKEEIQPRTRITSEMISYMDIPEVMMKKSKSFKNKGIILNKNEILDYYTNYNTVVPAGSPFYRENIVTWDQMPDSAWADIPDGYTVVSIPVNNETTYGNSIFPGNTIDLYYVTKEKTGKLLLGELIESIPVLAVKDSNGRHVFENSREMRQAASLIFAVPESLHLLVRKAAHLDGTIFPVPRNANYSADPGVTVVSSEYIMNHILEQTVDLSGDTPVPIEDLKDLEEMQYIQQTQEE